LFGIRDCQLAGSSVRLRAVQHRTRLGSRSAVGLADRDVIAGLRLPLFGEGGVDVLIQLARRIVRNKNDPIAAEIFM
jgi:hypothetical protein